MNCKVLHYGLNCYGSPCNSDDNLIFNNNNVLTVYCGLHYTKKVYNKQPTICNIDKQPTICNIDKQIYKDLSAKTTLYTNRLMTNNIYIDIDKFTTEKIHFFTVDNGYLCLFLYNSIINIYNIHQYIIDKPIAIFTAFAVKPQYVNIFNYNNMLIITLSNTIVAYDLTTHTVVKTDICFNNEITSSCILDNKLLAICENTIYSIEL